MQFFDELCHSEELIKFLLAALWPLAVLDLLAPFTGMQAVTWFLITICLIGASLGPGPSTGDK